MYLGLVKKERPCGICGKLTNLAWPIIIDNKTIAVVACSLQHATMLTKGQRLKKMENQ